MPDPDSSPPLEAVKRAPSYRKTADPATPSLAEVIHRKIEAKGPLCFTDFMAIALYEPTLGYYARETRQVGREGDFFTSVSVGPLFGGLLARRFLREWEDLGRPGRWRIIECGAHDGTLGRDVLDALRDRSPEAFAALEYTIPEPLPLLQAAQREKLAAFADTVRFISTPDELSGDPLPGVAFGNELLDALPFHVVRWSGGEWRECRVSSSAEGAFVWDTDHPVTDPALAAALEGLGSNFPDGYQTEVRTNYGDFLEPLTRCLSSGLLLWPDYGFARPEYYLPERTAGTLRTFSKHRAAEDPLAAPGEMDITAHVDFTAAAEAAMALGCEPVVFRNQGAWLTENGRDWLLSLEGNADPGLLHQFRTLTHPAHLGGCFHMLELAWKKPGASCPEIERHRLALRTCRGSA
ncbi:MAG: SAM-dependent methyltransferase [Verrucomicrobiaceae bacterium]|nr:MAG: SAM-dependent methyltransferase [Verrucomicrobiaceae bacterium]